MNKISIGLTVLEMGFGFMSSRQAKRQALRDKYDKLAEENTK